MLGVGSQHDSTGSKSCPQIRIPRTCCYKGQRGSNLEELLLPSLGLGKPEMPSKKAPLETSFFSLRFLHLGWRLLKKLEEEGVRRNKGQEGNTRLLGPHGHVYLGRIFFS